MTQPTSQPSGRLGRLLGLMSVLSAFIASAQGAGRVWVRLVDESGAGVAARVYVRDGAGQSLVPAGSLGRQNWRSDATFFHADGQFQMEASAGDVTIEAVRGFEYEPARATVQIRDDTTVTRTLRLKRWIDLPALGWHSGDVHMHPNHVEGGVHMTMEDCQLYAQAEDIHVANLLISSTDSAHVFGTEFFNAGKPDLRSTARHLLVVQEEFRNTSAMYGHMPLLGIKRLVEPFFSGQADSKQWEDYPPNYTIAKAARDQGGVVCYTHPAQREGIPVGPHLAREFPIDLALGVVDALDILGNGDEVGGCWMYYRVLNCGLRCAASSGSDSRMDVLKHAVSGGGKVYVQTGNPLTYEKWIAGYKAGRTFVSNGPMIFLEVEGASPGDTINLTAPGNVRVTARAHSPVVPVSVLELVVNGRVVAQTSPAPGSGQAELHVSLPVERSSWIAARVGGDGHRLVVNDPKAFAHTSPVYLSLAGRPTEVAEDARLVIAWIERLIEDVSGSPRFSNESRRAEVIALFRRGQDYYRSVLDRAQK